MDLAVCQADVLAGHVWDKMLMRVALLPFGHAGREGRDSFAQESGESVLREMGLVRRNMSGHVRLVDSIG